MTPTWYAWPPLMLWQCPAVRARARHPRGHPAMPALSLPGGDVSAPVALDSSRLERLRRVAPYQKTIAGATGRARTGIHAGRLPARRGLAGPRCPRCSFREGT